MRRVSRFGYFTRGKRAAKGTCNDNREGKQKLGILNCERKHFVLHRGFHVHMHTSCFLPISPLIGFVDPVLLVDFSKKIDE